MEKGYLRDLDLEFLMDFNNFKRKAFIGSAVISVCLLLSVCNRPLPQSPFTDRQRDSIWYTFYRNDSLNSPALLSNKGLDPNEYFPMQVGNQWTYFDRVSNLGVQIQVDTVILRNGRNYYQLSDQFFSRKWVVDSLILDTIYIRNKIQYDTIISLTSQFDSTLVYDTLYFRDTLYSIELLFRDSITSDQDPRDTTFVASIQFSLSHKVGDKQIQHSLIYHFLDSLRTTSSDTFSLYLTRVDSLIRNPSGIIGQSNAVLAKPNVLLSIDTLASYIVTDIFVDSAYQKNTDTLKIDTTVKITQTQIQDTLWDSLSTLVETKLGLPTLYYYLPGEIYWFYYENIADTSLYILELKKKLSGQNMQWSWDISGIHYVAYATALNNDSLLLADGSALKGTSYKIEQLWINPVGQMVNSYIYHIFPGIGKSYFPIDNLKIEKAIINFKVYQFLP